jgi:hypothetical protein
MRGFHLVVHVDPGLDHRRAMIYLIDREVEALDIDASQLTRPFSESFDRVVARMESLPRLVIEPDGALLWVGDDPLQPWQLDGQLHDSAMGLMSVELKGWVPGARWQDLLGCLDWPKIPLVFQLVREGIYLDADGLRAVYW